MYSLVDEALKGKKPQNIWYFKTESFCISKFNLRTNAFKSHKDRHFGIKFNQELIFSD